MNKNNIAHSEAFTGIYVKQHPPLREIFSRIPQPLKSSRLLSLLSCATPTQPTTFPAPFPSHITTPSRKIFSWGAIFGEISLKVQNLSYGCKHKRSIDHKGVFSPRILGNADLTMEKNSNQMLLSMDLDLSVSVLHNWMLLRESVKFN